VRRAVLASLVLALGLTSAAASAIPVTWTLQGVTFTDGGTASGSFAYDADTNTYSSVNITTTPGSVILTGATLVYVSPGFAPSNDSVLTAASNAADLTGTRAFALFFGSALTNVGGTVSIASGEEASCANSTCSAPTAPNRFTSAGSVSAQTLEIPALSARGLAATALLLAAAALLALRRSL